jgi:hypothetical protein
MKMIVKINLDKYDDTFDLEVMLKKLRKIRIDTYSAPVDSFLIEIKGICKI